MRADDFFREMETESPEFARARRREEPSLFLALNVSRLRRALNLSQQQLGETAGMRQPKIAQIERGDANPELKTLARLAEALGVRVESLLAPPSDYGGQSAAGAHVASEGAFSIGVEHAAQAWRGMVVTLTARGAERFPRATAENENFALAS
jgi:transcriptional regulator with XRE-family HTH domain